VAQLDRILSSAAFKAPEKQRDFLRFVVNEKIAGRESQLKGYTIALAIYGRPDGFDPQVDPIVRVEAGRLRRALEHYYLTDGECDPLRITIPKGRYVPSFEPNDLKTGAPEPEVRTAQASIAVMPVSDMATDGDHAFFADGLTEELTAELSRYQDLRVIASQSSMRFKGQQIDPRKVGADLGVRFLLAGSVRREAGTVKILVQLLDTTTAEQIWSESFTREASASHLIRMQEDIASRVVGVVADQWGLIGRRLSRESARKAPADLSAYEAVLRFYHYETVLTPESFESAFLALSSALETEPEYGLAWSMLGHLHADNHALGFREVDHPLEKALEYASKGVALEPGSQLAWDSLALAHFHLGNKDRLFETIDKTIALNPNSPYIVGVAGWHLALCGEWKRGLELLAKGMELNPFHPTWFHLAPFMDHFRRGEYLKAYAEALRFNFPGLFWDPLMRAAALERMDRGDEARDAIGKLLDLVPEFVADGRRLIGTYVRVESLVEELIEALRKAGLPDLA
jgi:adenylate cyclase